VLAEHTSRQTLVEGSTRCPNCIVFPCVFGSLGHTGGQTSRQTDIQTGRQTDIQTGRQTTVQAARLAGNDLTAKNKQASNL